MIEVSFCLKFYVILWVAEKIIRIIPLNSLKRNNNKFFVNHIPAVFVGSDKDLTLGVSSGTFVVPNDVNLLLSDNAFDLISAFSFSFFSQ